MTNPTTTQLRDKIESRTVVLGVIGLGYVGLPLATAFAEAGFRTLGFDVNEKTVRGLNQKISHVKDIESELLSTVIDRGLFEATTDISRLSEADVISICVPTPLGKTREPDISYVQSATNSIASSLRSGQLIVLESTTYPGTTREVLLPQLESAGMSEGVDFFLAFSPERIDPGNPRYNIKNTPKIVGGISADSTDLATQFYSCVVEEVYPVSTPEAAEMVKLHENTFRAVNIALANETAMMCDKLGIDVWEVISAAQTKPFGFMPFYPGPGIGGHCIPLDPHYLSWKMETLNYRAKFIQLASEINSFMPEYWVDKVWAKLNEQGKSVKGSRVLVVGVAYKPDIDDVRESPALDIIGLLQEAQADVSYYDPYVAEIEVPKGRMSSVEQLNEGLPKFDLAVIVTNHSNLDRKRIASVAEIVISTRSNLQNASA